jgi:hypothetical protein
MINQIVESILETIGYLKYKINRSVVLEMI